MDIIMIAKRILIISTLLFANNAFANNISYVLAAREADLFRTQDRIADMTANVNTAAFKEENDVYSELPTMLQNCKNFSFSEIKTTGRDNAQGPLESTGRSLDVAISGPGYFMVETPRGIRYTRDGNLSISSGGVLTTKEGYPLLGPGGGQVEFAEDDIDVTIRENGLVSSGPEDRGQIGVFTFANEQLMIREGSGFYRTDQTASPTEESKVVQGVLEGSNVNSV